MNKLRAFVAEYRLYRKGNGPRLSFISAWRVVVQGLPF